MKRTDPEPLTCIGNCCGCQQYALLFKIEGVFRYRCANCYTTEVGRRPWCEPAVSA